MIINKLVFPIKSDLSFVEGGIPQGKLTANSINRDILYVISPAVKATVITAFFQNQKQTEDTQQATFTLSDLSIDYLVSKDTSYYELVKDWNVWQTTIPSKALEFISYNRAGKIGISFAFRQLLEPSGYEGSQEITNDNFVIHDSGSYIIKIPYYNFLGIDFTYNDVLIYNAINKVMFFSGIMPDSTNDPFPIYYRDIQAIRNKIHKITIDGVEKQWQLIENDSILSITVKPSVNMYLGLQTGEWSYEGNYQSDLSFKEIRIYYDSEGEVYKKPAIALQGTTGTLEYSVDPSVYMDGYELIDISLTESILSKLGLLEGEVIRVEQKADAHIEDLVSHNASPVAHSSEFNKKLDKLWGDITAQTTTLLTDELVINRGNEVYKSTLADLLAHAGFGDIFVIVQTLPTTGQPNKIYLVPVNEPDAKNEYEEYLWVNSEWELLGNLHIDLSDYYSKNETNGLLETKLTKSNEKASDLIEEKNVYVVNANRDQEMEIATPYQQPNTIVRRDGNGTFTDLEAVKGDIGDIQNALDIILGV